MPPKDEQKAVKYATNELRTILERSTFIAPGLVPNMGNAKLWDTLFDLMAAMLRQEPLMPLSRKRMYYEELRVGGVFRRLVDLIIRFAPQTKSVRVTPTILGTTWYTSLHALSNIHQVWQDLCRRQGVMLPHPDWHDLRADFVRAVASSRLYGAPSGVAEQRLVEGHQYQAVGMIKAMVTGSENERSGQRFDLV
ncbi:hypothetical protein DL93DRAFT_296532 [Clavulina sp. PMI_390]|nr:hypothetical protein DL93DRAFT_296532 [Clavulina sp. PMI_390]